MPPPEAAAADSEPRTIAFRMALIHYQEISSGLLLYANLNLSGRISATGHSLSVRRAGGEARGPGDCRSFSFESTDAGKQAIVAEHEPEPQPEPETASEF